MPKSGRLLLSFIAILINSSWGQEFPPQATFALESVATASSDGPSFEITVVNDAGTPVATRVSLRKKGAELKAGVDPVGRGLDREGCFYVDGHFSAKVAAGLYELWVRAGFSRVPYLGDVELTDGKSHRGRVTLPTWFSPENLGWYAADFHLHGFHAPVTPADINTRTPTGKIDYDFMALAARSAGLNFAVDNMTHSTVMPREECLAIETATRRRHFILQLSSEIRIDWQGHVNVPGTAPGLFARTVVEHPLPLLQILQQAQREGGVMVYTHPLRIPWFYWMAATEMPAHVVLEQHGHFFDIARPERTPAMVALFALWNLGVRVAAAATTDNQFNRGIDERTRTFLKPAEFTLDSLLQAGRDRAAIASTGTVFATIEIGAKGPGAVVTPGEHRLNLEVHALQGVRDIEVIVDGKIVAKLPGDGARHLRKDLTVAIADGGYVSIVARDNAGGFAVPTAIFAGEAPQHDKFHTAFYATEADRVKKTTNQYFLHLLATVNANETIKVVRLMKDGTIIEEIRDDLLTPQSRLPNSGFNPGTQHEKCWLFWPSPSAARYFTLSYPITGDGEFRAVIETQSGRRIDAGRIIYRKEAQCWQGGMTRVWNSRAEFYLETSAFRPESAIGTDAFRGDWVTTFKVTASGLRGNDLQAKSRPANHRSRSELIAPER